MATTKRTVTIKEVIPQKELPKTIEIPLTILRHLVRQTGNRQAKFFLIKAGGTGYKVATPGANVIEPEIVKAEKTVKAKEVIHRAITKEATPKGAADKKFN